MRRAGYEGSAPPRPPPLLVTASELRRSCPFSPPEGDDVDLILPSHGSRATSEQASFDRGMLRGIAELLLSSVRTAVGGRRPSVLDLNAGLGQLRSALDGPGGVDVSYVGFDWGIDVMDLVGRNVPLLDDRDHVVPPICWADPSFPVDARGMALLLGGHRSFDLALGIVGAGQFVRSGWGGAGTFLDNLVRAVTTPRGGDSEGDDDGEGDGGGRERGGTIVLAWRNEGEAVANVEEEMMRRGASLDRDATIGIRRMADSPFLREFASVYRLGGMTTSYSAPVILTEQKNSGRTILG